MGEFDELILFIPGPTYIRPEVLEAGKLPVFGHRDKEATLRMQPIVENLRKISGVGSSYKVVLIPGTGTSSMEISIRSLANYDDKILCLSVGAFGDLYYDITVANGKNSEKLYFEPGNPVDIEVYKKKLDEYKPDLVVVTHNETSTGVINDIKEICTLAKEKGALTLVDGVSIFGGVPSLIEEAKIDFYSASTQKCLALPAGLGIAFVFEDALKKAEQVKNRGIITDILKHVPKAEKFQTLTTTPTQLVNQLYFQTKAIIEKGVEERFKKHEEMKEIVHEWVKGLGDGFSVLPDKENASPSVTCIKVPESLDRVELKERVRKKGYLCDKGYSKLKISTIRIPHMGDITPSMLKGYLAVLEEEIKEMC